LFVIIMMVAATGAQMVSRLILTGQDDLQPKAISRS
jgi:hypothetical protein